MQNTTSNRLAYLLSGFPRLSETFILNEILELERQGLPLVIFSLKKEMGAQGPAEVTRLKSPVIYIPEKLSVPSYLSIYRANVALLLQSPQRYLRVTRQFLSTGKKERFFSIYQSFLRWIWFGRQLQKLRVARIHAHFAHDPTTMAYWVNRLLDIPYSFTAHAKDIYCYSEEWLQKKIHSAQWVATCTDYNKQHLQAVSQNGTAIYRLYHGIDLEKFKAGTRTQRSVPLVLAVGRLVEKKGFPSLISACNLLRSMGLAFQCLIVGEGPLRSALQEQIDRLGLSHQVGLGGALNHKRLLSLYKMASVFVMPSVITENGDRDGIPNVILEAMAMELPVVASRVSGIPEAVAHAKTGLLVEQRDARALATAIRNLLYDTGLARRLGQSGRRKVQADFNLHCNTKKMKELLIT
ncbi:MAG: glycosyltransferase [bacterium]